MQKQNTDNSVNSLNLHPVFADKAESNPDKWSVSHLKKHQSILGWDDFSEHSSVGITAESVAKIHKNCRDQTIHTVLKW